MNRLLQISEEALLVIIFVIFTKINLYQYELQITPDLVSELETWLHDPYFLESRRNFTEIHEQDIKLFYGLEPSFKF